MKTIERISKRIAEWIYPQGVLQYKIQIAVKELLLEAAAQAAISEAFRHEAQIARIEGQYMQQREELEKRIDTLYDLSDENALLVMKNLKQAGEIGNLIGTTNTMQTRLTMVQIDIARFLFLLKKGINENT